MYHLPVSSQRVASQEGDGGTVTLLVSGTQSINDDLLTLYFEQFSDDVNVKKHGEDGWILRLSNQSGKWHTYHYLIYRVHEHCSAREKNVVLAH